MNDTSKSDFEADLEAIMGSAEPSTEVTSDPTPAATPKAESLIEAGGRKFKDTSELAKSYDGLLKDYTKTKQEMASAKEWVDFDKYLRQNPELREALKSQVDDYINRRQAGQSKTKAKEESDIPDVMAERIEALEQRWEDTQLDQEVEAIRTKHDLDQETLDAVLHESLENRGLSLEKAYRIVMSDKLEAAAKDKVEKSTQENQSKKKAANVGSSSAANITPSEKSPNSMSEGEYRDALSRELERYNIS